MSNDNIATKIGLFLGSIIISGLVLDRIGYFSILLLTIFSIIIFVLLYYFLLNKTKVNRYEIILSCFLVFISLLLIMFRKFPFSDFWWYHEKNWIIANYLYDIGKVIHWMPFWHFGDPLLHLYGPGSHIIVIFFTKLLSINIFYAEIIVNSLTYLILILALNLFLSKHISNKLAFFSSLFIAISPRLFNEVFIQGHYPNLLSLAFGLIGLSFLDSKNKKELILFSFFMFLSLITHFSFFTILMLATFLTFIISRKFKDYKILFRFALPILLAAFWLLPAIIEAKYWHGIVPGPSPIILYLLSFGPLLILVLFGFYYLFKDKQSYLSYFIISLLILSFVPFILFPLLPGSINNLLQKVFVDTFKSTVTTSIFLAVLIAVVISKAIKNIRYRKLGISLLVLFIIFSVYLDYLYTRQDAVDVIKFNDEYYRADNYNKLLINNYDKIKLILNDKNKIYGIDSIFAPQLFKVFTAYGPPIPAPKRVLEYNEVDYIKLLEDNGVDIFLLEKKDYSDEIDEINTLGYYNEIVYDLSYSYIKKIVKEGNLFNYLVYPEEFPSSKVQKELVLYKADNFNRNITDYEIADGRIVISPKTEGIVRINVNYSPHWKAYIDGEKVKIEKDKYDFVVIKTDKDDKEIILKWEKNIYDYIGIIISIMVLIFIIYLMDIIN